MSTAPMNVIALLAERDKLRQALQDLYDAMPSGYGEDRALNEALILAEQALGIEKEGEPCVVLARAITKIPR